MKLSSRRLGLLAFVVSAAEKRFFLARLMHKTGHNNWEHDIDEASAERLMARSILALFGIVVNSEPVIEDGCLKGVRLQFDEMETVSNTMYEKAFLYSADEVKLWGLDKIKWQV